MDWQNFFGWGGIGGVEGLGVFVCFVLLWGNFVLKLSRNTKIILGI